MNNKVSTEEKKKFLSMDLAERMMRVEQNISATFNHPVTYEQTEYFKSLNSQQKKEFKEYLRNKNKKKLFSWIFFIILPIFIIVLLNKNFTGNVILENINPESSLILSFIVIAFIIIASIVLIVRYINKKQRHKIFNKHAKVIEDVVFNKRIIKKKKK